MNDSLLARPVRLIQRRSWCSWGICGLLLGVALMMVHPTGAEPPRRSTDGSGPSNVAPQGDASSPPWIDPARVVGVADGDCRTCHASEVAAWKHTAHARADERLYEPHARDYAAALGIAPEDVRTNSLCLRCHTTQAMDRHGRIRPIGGVSCESCHGAAGGNPGWLNPHAVYGPSGTTAKRETPEHFQRRVAFCESQGMVRPARIYELAKRCLSCHLVDVPELIDAGHSSGSFEFEFDAWSSGEIRHNFHQNPRHNAAAPSLLMAREGVVPHQRKRVKVVAGLLADLEATLRSRAQATRPRHADYAKELAERARALLARLAEIGEAETDAVVDLARPLVRKMEDVTTVERRVYLHAAARIGQVGRTFVENHDGSRLERVDRLISESPPAGTPFQPE